MIEKNPKLMRDNKMQITKNQFSDLINLLNNVFYPLKNFVSEKEFINIVNQKKIKKKFFPFPIFFGSLFFQFKTIEFLFNSVNIPS